MVLKIFNTLGRKIQTFKPMKEKEVKMYTCGPTVYNFAHIGNFRAYIVADLLVRYLEFKGFKVKQIMNITDVDDKTIRDSQKEGVSLKGFTERYTKYFFEDVKTLNIKPAFAYPKATESIKGMVELINKLLEKGIAYRGEDGSIYYNIMKFDDYGKLSGINLEDLKSGARVKQDEYTKEQAHDFALWKSYDPSDGDVYWEPTFIIDDKEVKIKGRPGWHIECSVMSTKNLGNTFDIHTGGVDLIFPHHENEIAQSEGATGEKFVHYWIHNEHLMVEGKKMSKSLGNFFTLRDLLKKGYNPKSIRYVLLNSHYRQKLNFTFQDLEAAKNTIDRMFDFVDRLKESEGRKNNKKISELVEKARKDFEEAMDNDLHINKALASFFSFMRTVNKEMDKQEISKENAKQIYDFVMDIDSVLGLLEMREKKELKISEEEIEDLIKKREEARKNKDWKKADSIRDQLKEKGIILEDTAEGVKWKIEN
jgi:cysteinyl-tRNA synthetase